MENSRHTAKWAVQPAFDDLVSMIQSGGLVIEEIGYRSLARRFPAETDWSEVKLVLKPCSDPKPLESRSMNEAPVDSLDSAIAQAIDRWHAGHPDLRISEIFSALDIVAEAIAGAAGKYDGPKVVVDNTVCASDLAMDALHPKPQFADGGETIRPRFDMTNEEIEKAIGAKINIPPVAINIDPAGREGDWSGLSLMDTRSGQIATAMIKTGQADLWDRYRIACNEFNAAPGLQLAAEVCAAFRAWATVFCKSPYPAMTLAETIDEMQTGLSMQLIRAIDRAKISSVK